MRLDLAVGDADRGGDASRLLALRRGERGRDAGHGQRAIAQRLDGSGGEQAGVDAAGEGDDGPRQLREQAAQLRRPCIEVACVLIVHRSPSRGGAVRRGRRRW